MTRQPLWGNFLYFADQDLLSFAWLYVGGLRVPGFYHATQAVEKYLKALTLSIVDPDGITETTRNNRWLRTHDLDELAQRCAPNYRYYADVGTVATLKKFSEFDQAARYPWVDQKFANGFSSSDLPAFWELIHHLRNDIPIKLDNYLLGMVVRGHFQGKPQNAIPTGLRDDMSNSIEAIRRMFPDVNSIVRW